MISCRTRTEWCGLKTRMDHVGLITSSYPDGKPGQEAAGSFVADFAYELSLHLRVTVVAASSVDSLTSDGALTVRRFAVPRTPLSLLKPLRPSDWIPIIQTLHAGRRALASLAKLDRPDHILGLWALPGGYWAEAVARQYNLPFSIWALGSDIWGLRDVPFVRTKLKTVLGRANIRYADGIQLARDVEEICDLECRFLPSTRQLPQPAESGLSSKPPYKLAFLGRWHVNKGIDLLLDALFLLTDQDWEKIAEVRINGGGPLDGQVRNAVRKMQTLRRPVTLDGYLDKREASDLFGWADYLLLPSRIESIPVVFSDAVQLRTPIVSTPVGDLPRLYEKFPFGIIASELSVPAYAEAIRSALNSVASKYVDDLNLASQEFDLKKIVARFLDEIST
jgi:glycosyltransferase involved in cell wall biosynthesis